MKAGRLSGVVALVLTCGCGGGAAPGEAKSPDPSEAAETEKAAPDEPAEKAEGAGEAGEKTPPTEGGDEEATVALEGKDLEAVLQILLGDKELLDHLHLNLPGRAPLKVYGEKLPQKLAVIAGSHEVKVVAEPKSKKEAVLVFTKVERTGKQAKLYYRYDVEGVDGRATFVLKDGHWELSANRLVEK